VSGAGHDITHRWTFGLRLLTNQIPRASVRTTLTYRFHERVQAGVEYNPRADEVGVIANVLLLRETEKRPALMIGTSTDRIGTPSGQSFYATLSKNLRRETGLPIAPYVGVAFGTFDDRLRPVAGLNITLSRRFSLLGTINGVNVHGLLNFTHGQHTMSLVMVKGRDPGMSYSFSF
jgi:hypothetical protein